MSADRSFEIEFNFRNKRYADAQVGLRALAKNIDHSTADLPKELNRALFGFLTQIAIDLSKKHSRRWPRGTTAITMSKRSGNAMQSVRRSVRVTGTTLDNTTGYIGGIGWLRIHEFGGTIRAKRAKYLTIPLPPALNADGTPKKPNARSWPNTFVGRSRRGKLIIFQKRGRQLTPLYVLKPSVRIPPRLGMGEMLEKRLPLFVEQATNRMLRKLIDG